MKDHTRIINEADQDELDDLQIALDRLNDTSDAIISEDDLRKVLGLSD